MGPREWHKTRGQLRKDVRQGQALAVALRTQLARCTRELAEAEDQVRELRAQRRPVVVPDRVEITWSDGYRETVQTNWMRQR